MNIGNDKNEEIELDKNKQIKNYGKINKLNITFLDKVIYNKNTKITSYKYLIFEGKKFYLMTKPNYFIKNNEYKYYCNNNNTYINSTNGKSHSICKYQIIFNEIYNNYIVINGHGHSGQCLIITKINY